MNIFSHHQTCSNANTTCDDSANEIVLSEIYSLPSNPHLGRPAQTITQPLVKYNLATKKLSEWIRSEKARNVDEREESLFYQRRRNLQNMTLSFAVETTRPYCYMPKEIKPGQLVVRFFLPHMTPKRLTKT